MLELDPHASHVTQALLRLHRQTGNWRALLELLETQLTVLPWEQHGRVYAEMAFVLEWRLESAAEAFHIFLKAAEFQPAELHWLHGIVRTWRAAHIDAFQLSKVLEDLALRPMAAEARDAYFLAISRLRERFEKRPEKSVGYRVHGDESNRENQAVLRLANALTKDRSGLERRRAESPWFDFEQVVDHREWTSRRRQALQRVMDQANDDERTWLTSWLPNGMAQAWIEADDGGSQVLRYELERIVSGNGQRLDCRTHEMLLLRAEELKTAGDIQGWTQTVADEIALSPSRELRVLRLIDLARCVPASQWLEKAVNEAFGEDPCIDDGAVANHLFDALREAQAYELLRFALETHVLSVQLSDGRRAEIFGELGQLLEEKLLDLEASRRAYEHCWQLTGEREQLASIVRVCKSLGHIESATEFQTRHFEATLNGDFSLEERLKSGMELSELNVQIGDTARAIKHLEMLLHPESSSPMYREAKLRLAHLQCDDGDVQRGISLFEGTLTIKACAADIEHWRRLVRAYRSDVGDLAASYSLQWKLVRARPESLDDVDELLEIAWEINELSDCCKQLEEFGRTLELDAQVTLIGRAAVALDEDLGRSEDAARLYRELVAIGGPSSTLDFRRRLAFSLARSVGRESEALKHFELLCREEPFEGTNYQGMVDLYERTQCFDRARVARQFMRTLNMKVEGEEIRAKSTPSRPFADNDIRHLLLPKQLQKVFPAIHAVMPVAEKIWSGDLPQKKAVDGHKVKEGKFTDMLAQACQLFGLKRVRAFATDAGPLAPFVFQEASPALWFNSDLLSEATDGELKFLAGYAAAMAWSEASGLVALDGRNVWHLMEGIAYRQTGAGFTDRIDAESQRLADEVGSPFYAVARRRVAQALDGLGPELADAHCEAWPLLLQRFACRVGLIACSDVEDATRAMLRMDGWVESLNDEATQRRMRRSSEVEELFRFAASEEFLEARHRVGLGSRPSQFARE
jgi:tetratricopeptide (TPR) repeat protein